MVRWLFLVGLAVSQSILLQNGVPYSDEITAREGGQRFYQFVLPNVEPNEDLSITVTTFSDMSDPDIFVSRGAQPTNQTSMWRSTAWGSGVIFVPSGSVQSGEYFAMVQCVSACAYDVLYSYVSETQLRLGVPQIGRLLKDRTAIFAFSLEQATGLMPPNVTFTVAPYDPDADVKVAVAVNGMPTFENSLPLSPVWPVGFQCTVPSAEANAIYRVSILAQSDFAYQVTVLTPGQVLTLQPSVPVRGNSSPSQFTYYRVTVSPEAKHAKAQLTVFTGQPRIYLRYDEAPTLDWFDFTNHWINDTVFIPPNAIRPGNLYIGVYSESWTAYTVYFATNSRSWIPIYPGLPQAGVVRNTRASYFLLDVSSLGSHNITFRVSPIEGNPNLYVRLCRSANTVACAFSDEELRHPENFNIYSSRRREGDDYVMIPHNGASCVDSVCRYAVAVAGQGEGMGSRYVLSAAFDNSTQYTLMHDVPVRMTLHREGYVYFKYTAFSLEADTITFQLTPITGDPDLYISQRIEKPTMNEYDKASTKSSLFIDSVTYSQGVDGPSLNGTYYIGVFSWAQTTFSLLVHESVPDRNSTIRLYQGQPQQGVVYRNVPGRAESDYRLYMFDINFPDSERPTITVSLMALTGVLHIYVANSPAGLDLDHDMFIYQWCTCFINNTSPAQTIAIEAGDKYYQANSVYLVLVKAETFASDSSASFIVSYSIDGSLVYLQDGIPYFDEVKWDKYKYYSFPLSQDHEDLTVQLTAFTGDPDLYMLVNNSAWRPDKNHSHYNSTVFGSSDLYVPWENIKPYCPFSQETTTFGHMHDCVIYIGVYGYLAATYSIRVVTNRSEPVMLQEGTTSTGYINASQFAYYYTFVRTDVDIAVHLQSLEGDSDLYVNVLDFQTSGAIGDWRRPNRDINDFVSRSAVLNDFVPLSNGTLQAKCPSGTCIVLSGVFCFTSTCHYIISITQDQVLLIHEGVPVVGSVESGMYAYYKFYNQKSTASILITLTPLSFGDPDLFVSKGLDMRPTSDNSTWRSTAWRGDELLINSTDPAFSESGSMRGYYIIGVRGFTNVSYSLTVTTDPQPIRQLLNGVPVQSEVPAWSGRYFSFYNYRFADITLTLTPLHGSAMLRVNALPPYTGQLYQNLPARDNSTWSSTASGHQNLLVISANDSYYCTQCTYVIAVFADEQNCSFSLSAGTGEDAMVLQNGVPTLGQVGPGAWKYYTFFVDSYSDIDISVVNYAGDADLYVGTSIPLNVSSARWKQTTSRHVEHLTISARDPYFTYGQYSIGVYGVRNTSFSITAHARDSYITLVDGWPQSYSIMQYGEDHLAFRYYMSVNNADVISCRLRRQEPGFWPRVFAAFRPFSVPGQASPTVIQPPPSSSAADFSYDRQHYDQVYGTLTFNLPANRNPGDYAITVYGMHSREMREEVGTFELSCSGQTNSTVLLAGRTEYGFITQLQRKQRFQLYASEPGVLEITAIPCTGRISLSVSSNYTWEQNSGPDVVVSRVVDGKIKAEMLNALGAYYVTLTLIQAAEDSDGATFQLSYEFYPQGTKRPRKIVPGNEGQIVWESAGANRVKLNWTVPEVEDGSEVKNAGIYYLVYVTNNTQVKMNTVCGMRVAEDRGTVWVAPTDNSSDPFALIEVQEGKPQVVNVIAVVFQASGLERLPYTPTEVFVRRQRQGRRVGLVFIGSVTAVLLLALVGLFILWRKYRRVKRTLENEMQDVRNVASISSDQVYAEDQKPAGQTAIYQPLELTKE